MKTAWRTLGTGPVRDIMTVLVATGFVGISYGAIAMAAGLPAWAVIAFSVVVFAGGSQFLAVSLVAAGNPAAAIFGGLLLNARHFPFGLTVADAVGGSWPRRLVGSHVMVDEAVAFAVVQPDGARRRAAYWFTGVGIFVVWQIGTLLGVLAGSAVDDPAVYGLDAAFPAALLLLVAPRLRESAGRRVAALAAAASVASAFVAPAGLPVLLGLLGLLAVGSSVITGTGEPSPAGSSSAGPSPVESGATGSGTTGTSATGRASS